MIKKSIFSKYKNTIGIILGLFFYLIPIFAAEISVTGNVDRNQMRPGDTFTYSISITASGSVSFDQPKLPDMSAFEVMNSWSGSETKGSFINGQVETQKSQTYNYMLAAPRQGQFTIGAAEVVINGQTFRTNPIKISVSQDAPQAPAQAQQQNPGAGDDVDDFENDIFSQLLRRHMNPRGGIRGAPGGGSRIQAVNPSDAFFIHVEVDKKKVYQGEQVVASWYLVTRTQIADIDTLKYPALSGFWKEDIEVATRLSFQPEVINGIPYQKARLASYALFPIKAGVSTIDPYQAKCRVIAVNGIGLPQESYITKQSDEIKIEVMPLPVEGKTENFTGGVGDFTVSANVDTAKVKADSPLTLKVRIEGRGNAKVVDQPKLNLPEFVQIYDTKSDMKFYPNGRGYKEFETLLVPRQAGEFKIPPISFSFFNPEQKKYYTQSTSEMTITVEPGAGGGVIAAQKLNNPNVKTIEKKLTLPSVLLSTEASSRVTFAQELYIWAIVFLLTLSGLAGFGYREFGRRVKREDLLRKVNRKISEIEVKLDRGDWRGVGVDTTNLVYQVLGEIAGLGGASFEFDKMVDKAPPSFKRGVAPLIKTLMSKLELIGFAPENMVGAYKDKKELKKVLDEAEKLLLEAAKYDFTSTGENDKNES